jgi:hypothetical protein
MHVLYACVEYFFILFTTKIEILERSGLIEMLPVFVLYACAGRVFTTWRIHNLSML